MARTRPVLYDRGESYPYEYGVEICSCRGMEIRPSPARDNIFNACLDSAKTKLVLLWNGNLQSNENKKRTRGKKIVSIFVGRPY